MNERRNPASYDGKSALADAPGDVALTRVPGARPVEGAISQHDRDRDVAEHCGLHLHDGPDGAADWLRRLRPERILLRLDVAPLRLVPSGHALHDHAANVRCARSGDQVCRALAARAV